MIIQWGLNLLGSFQDVMDAIEAAVKAIIMVLVYILLAFELLMLTLGFILLLPFLLIIDTFPFTSTSWTLFNFSITMIINKNYEFKFILGFIIEWKYVSLLDLKLPFTKFTFNTNITNIIEENVPQRSNKISIESCILSISGGDIKLPEDNTPPVCNNTPSDISMWQNETGNIWWELYDESGGGTYRVLKNGTIVVNWTEWNNSKSIDYVINDTSSPGRTKYTIEFKDRSGNSNSDDVYVFVVKEGWPLSTHPNDIVAYTGDYISINWGLRDKEYNNPSDPHKYYYRVLLNGTVVKNWTEWPEIDSPMSPGARSDILYHVDTSEVGTYNYTIQFKDPDGHFGNDTMFVKILWGGSGEIPGSKIFQWKYLYQIIPNFLFLMEFILIFCVLIYCYYKMKKIILKG
ncbi:hypothetical protein DRQ26_07280 [bacterium]|nr:MAG: hypothetical protein DRQ26_07280 [bacterium]